MNSAEPCIVGTFGAGSADELLHAVHSAAASACDMVELRLDTFAAAPADVVELVRDAAVPVIATCRRATEGGRHAPDEDARLDLLRAAADAGAAWVDLEHDVPDDVAAAFAGGKARLLRSIHVERLPGDADSLARRLLALPGDAAKLIAMEGGDADAFRVLDLVRAYAGRLAAHLVSRPATRAAGAFLGSRFVYAALRPGGSLGLGMPAVRTLLRHVGQFRPLRGVRPFLLLGADVRQSVSPDMLNAAFASTGVARVSLRWPCADPLPVLDALLRYGWSGAAVTIPHKVTALHHLLERGGGLADSARRIGAVNTVLVEDGRLVGHNTDLGGLLDALHAARPGLDLRGRTGLVLGAGGAARAACAAVRDLGGTPVVVARREAAARELVDSLPAEDVLAMPRAEQAFATGPLVLIDATPAGPPGGEPLVDPALLPPNAIVQDMLVAARPTALLAAAAARGLQVVPGFEMLLHQALRQLDLMGVAPVDAERVRAAGAQRLAASAKRVVLVGLRCTGKSVVGQELARMLARPFVDTDRLVAGIGGRTPDQMIADGQERRFRTLEAEALQAAAGRSGTVVATGGGAALHEAELRALCADAFVVWLDAADDRLLARLERAPRAALTTLPAAEEIARQREERCALYSELADRVLDTGERPVLAVAETLAALLV